MVVSCTIVAMHTLVTALGLELDFRYTSRCPQDSDGKHGKHSPFPSPGNLHIPKDDRWKHHNYHISENVDGSVCIIYNVLVCTISVACE